MNTALLLAALVACQEINPPEPAPKLKPASNIQARKEARDQIIKTVGDDAKNYTKVYGDLGIAALQQCSAETGKKIVRLHNEGALARVKNARAVLEAIRVNGPAVGAWVADHLEELVDPEALEIFCKYPMDVALELRDLEIQAAELRASRKLAPTWLRDEQGGWNVPWLFVIVLAAVVLVVILWKRKAPAP